jgi:hypothetical protein
MDDITEKELIQSLMPSKNRDAIFKTTKKSTTSTNDGGRSGSFFFFSQDKKYIVKTMTKYERDIYLSMLPGFIKYFSKMNEM